MLFICGLHAVDTIAVQIACSLGVKCIVATFSDQALSLFQKLQSNITLSRYCIIEIIDARVHSVFEKVQLLTCGTGVHAVIDMQSSHHYNSLLNTVSSSGGGSVGESTQDDRNSEKANGSNDASNHVQNQEQRPVPLPHYGLHLEAMNTILNDKYDPRYQSNQSNRIVIADDISIHGTDSKKSNFDNSDINEIKKNDNDGNNSYDDKNGKSNTSLKEAVDSFVLVRDSKVDDLFDIGIDLDALQSNVSQLLADSYNHGCGRNRARQELIPLESILKKSAKQTERDVALLNSNSRLSSSSLTTTSVSSDDIIRCLGVQGKWVCNNAFMNLNMSQSRALYLRSASVHYLFPLSMLFAPMQYGKLLHIVDSLMNKLQSGALTPAYVHSFSLEKAIQAVQFARTMKVGVPVLTM
jgi:hypothetical protein